MDKTLLIILPILCLSFLYFLTVAFGSQNSYVVDIQALTAKNVCLASKDSKILSSGNPTLKVVDRHGPCSTLPPVEKSIEQMLSDDQSRVDAIHRRVSAFSRKDKTLGPLTSTQIEARYGSSYGIASYIVSIGIGTPRKTATLVFDTGSGVTWVQCKPCQDCYHQKEQIFDPYQSSTFTNVSCNSNACKAVSKNTCSGSSCLYTLRYGDESSTHGYYAADTLTLTPDVITNFRFGCGWKNRGTFVGIAGLLALGPDKESFVSQTSDKYQRVFAYCLPGRSSAGYLSFGRGSDMSNTQRTPIPKNSSQLPDYYYITMTGVSVDGQSLQIAPAVFSNAGMIIDSGTTFTRLPPDAYKALSSAFRKNMTQYQMVPPPANSLFDTCYNFTGHDSVPIPNIGLQFSNGVDLELDADGILFEITISQVCLAFASNTAPSDLAILGSVQQRTFNVVYDIPNGEIGFSPQAC